MNILPIQEKEFLYHATTGNLIVDGKELDINKIDINKLKDNDKEKLLWGVFDCIHQDNYSPDNIQVFRIIVPRNYIIGENNRGNYRKVMHQRKMITILSHHVIPKPKLRDKGSRFNVQCLICPNSKVRLDPSNFNGTVKPIVDVMTNMGYWVDDNWKYLPNNYTSYGAPYIYPEGNEYELPDGSTRIVQKGDFILYFCVSIVQGFETTGKFYNLVKE